MYVHILVNKRFNEKFSSIFWVGCCRVSSKIEMALKYEKIVSGLRLLLPHFACSIGIPIIIFCKYIAIILY